MTEPSDHQAAVQALEGAFGELIGEYRRVLAEAANAVSPGMLPATFRVLSVVQHAGQITISGLVDRMAADKGQLSRSVSELESLGLVVRTPDPRDGRVRLITLTEEGRTRLEQMRGVHRERLALWPVPAIRQLAALVHALSVGDQPPA